MIEIICFSNRIWAVAKGTTAIPLPINSCTGKMLLNKGKKAGVTFLIVLLNELDDVSLTIGC